MDYTKPKNQIKKEFSKLFLCDQLQELTRIYDKVKKGNRFLRDLFPELAFIYIEAKEKEKSHLVTGTE